jgi:hypothetical protein
MPADTSLVIRGSAHCGPKCDGCANTSPISVTTALSVAWRPTLLVVRSIWTRSATVTTAPTVPQIHSKDYMLHAERRKNITACHDEQTREPRTRELLGSRPGKAHNCIIRGECTQV